jgi:SsrA-binding protein
VEDADDLQAAPLGIAIGPEKIDGLDRVELGRKRLIPARVAALDLADRRFPGQQSARLERHGIERVANHREVLRLGQSEHDRARVPILSPTMAPKGTKVVATNRKARHDYHVLDTYECGIALVGSEVKSLREGRVQLRDAYARVDEGEVWLHGAHISPYSFAQGRDGHEPERRRKLLLHRGEIDELTGRTQQESLTLVPLSIYFKEGKAKVELALARGRRHYDKRQAIATRDAQREAERAMGRARRGTGGRGGTGRMERTQTRG